MSVMSTIDASPGVAMGVAWRLSMTRPISNTLRKAAVKNLAQRRPERQHAHATPAMSATASMDLRAPSPRCNAASPCKGWFRNRPATSAAMALKTISSASPASAQAQARPDKSSIGKAASWWTASTATARTRQGSTLSATQAQAMFDNSCGLNSRSFGSAAAGKAAARSQPLSLATPAPARVARAQARFANACGSNSSSCAHASADIWNTSLGSCTCALAQAQARDAM
mmetsp:Transcript_5540/g.13840  ORF Transcript_5540/g.13840 Transcript_5540/m.13840 type:complete len:228 (+) Transcript_5540:329-1012(+)